MIQQKQIGRFLNFNSSTNYRISTKHHIIFWLVYFLFNTLRWGSYYHDYWYSLKTNIIGFPIHMTLCYFNIYFLMPKLIYRKKFVLYTAGILLAIYLMVLLKFYLTYFLISTNVWPEGPEETTTLSLNYVVQMMLGELYVVSFVTAIKITANWLREHKRATDLEKVQLETELRFLRTQVSPHFFFNTLNNIYSLSMEQSKKTPETVLKLSELMRYLLYETKQRKQSLSKEILCLQNYLDLERMRYGDSLNINMNISGDIEGKKIPPMLLLSFIENCFKHGANKNIDEVKIDIDFNVEGDFLYFKVANTLPKEEFRNHSEKPAGGIGIKNVKKRLALGYKENEYDLDIYEKDNRYIVELRIKVS
ncbi:sensor histidine kinase [Sinomicrobium weinanense]|uniref:Histidine kinase n=1 Tax=Sinomicrobium weinanense TaxID=2842200 RepID=A0A926JUR5_9FLAO|nr:histidine kinase [Sinomicrobium weinanense]MBC9797840.1 histidine kinase [Sinomicrobium weinanense]MBU3124675.1 histidine kinase [Sinomicrobium weinanense]